MKMHGLRANFVFNLAGIILPLILTIITLPIYISHIGTARYGLVSIVWVFLGYFGFLDLGLSRATANALAKCAFSSSGERSKIFLTSFWVNLFLGSIGGLILYFSFVPIMGHLLNMPQELKPELEVALPWVACLLPLSLVSGVGVGVLESRERFLITNILQVTGIIIGQLVPVLCAIFISPSLAVVIPAAVLSRGFAILLILGFVARDEWPLNLRTFDRSRSRELLAYGGWISISNLVNPVLSSLDQIVIGSVIGVSAVAHYSVPMNIVVQSQVLAAALSRTLFPKVSRSKPEEARRLTEQAFVTLSFGYGAICASSITMARPALTLWIGQDFANYAVPVVELLLVGGWINGLAFLPLGLLQGQGRPDITAKFHALELVPFVLILWLLTNQFGLMGAATAWVLRVTIDAALLCFAAQFKLSAFKSLLVPAACIIATFTLQRFVQFSLIDSLVTTTIIGSGLLGSSLFFDSSARDFILQLPVLKKLHSQIQLHADAVDPSKKNHLRPETTGIEKV